MPEVRNLGCSDVASTLTFHAHMLVTRHGFRHGHEPAGWIQSAGEESSDPTHAGHAETAGQVWACTGVSVL